MSVYFSGKYYLYNPIFVGVGGTKLPFVSVYSTIVIVSSTASPIIPIPKLSDVSTIFASVGSNV